MNTNKLFKKITAVATGATMLGATVMGALAADLSDYPDMFVDGGTFNGYIVIGDSAKSADTAAAIDITNSMFLSGSSGESTVTVIEGDSWLAETSSNFLEIGEALDDIESYLSESELDALSDEAIENSKGTADYEQFLYLNPDADSDVTFEEDDDDQVGYMYLIENNDVFAKYELEFTSALESDIDSNDRYEDIEDEEIVLMGITYTIVLGEHESDGPTLTLMGGSVSASLEEGETASFEIDGEDYEVTLLSVDGDDSDNEEVQFSINGETTNKLEDGDTDVLDGSDLTIGVYDITYQEYAGGIHRAKFFLGADKIELDNSATGGVVKVNEETINGLDVVFDYSNTSDEITIDSFYVNMTAQDDYYLAAGDKLSEDSELDEPQLLFTENWDIEFAEIYMPGMELTEVTYTESDAQLTLDVELEGGEVSFDVVYVDEDMDLVYAGEDEDEPFVMDIMNWSIAEDSYFFLSNEDPTDADSDAKSYLLRYDSADACDDDGAKIYFTNIATGESIERSLDDSSSDCTFDIKLGGTTFEFSNGTKYLNSTGNATSTISEVSLATTDDWDVSFDGTVGQSGWTVGADGHKGTLSLRTADNHLVELATDNMLSLMNASFSSETFWNETVNDTDNDVDLTITVDDTDKYDDTGDASVVVFSATFADASDEISPTLQTGTMTDEQSESDPSDNDIDLYRTFYGSLLTVDSSSSSSPDNYDIEIPSEQAEVKMYVTSGATYSVATASGSADRVAIPVDANKFDSEISSVSAQNLIVVGGPCVNTVAAELMGNPSNCAEGFTPGVARIKLFENGDSVAMLVAGYSADDTTLAGEVIATRASELSGMESTVEGSTSSSASISSVQ